MTLVLPGGRERVAEDEVETARGARSHSARTNFCGATPSGITDSSCGSEGEVSIRQRPSSTSNSMARTTARPSRSFLKPRLVKLVGKYDLLQDMGRSAQPWQWLG